jgi:hypothetical protein
MDDGDYSTALALLEDAGLHAPTLLEKARSLAVMAVLTSAVLGESIGALQSLSLYYETYQTWTSAVSASDYGKAAGSLSAWIREALAGAFTPYADAYPEAAKSLSLDQISVRSAEAARGRNDSPRPVAKWSQITSMFDDLKKDARRFAAADNAGEWFGAERERLARLDARALLDEADHAVAQGFREARWFAETLAQLYALGLADDKKRIYTALRRAADGCDEPWRGQLEVFLGASADLAEVIGASSADSASALQIRTSLKSARRFGLHRTAAIFGELVRLGPKTAEPPTFAFDELPPPLAWWTTEYLDWFIATTWSLLNRPDGVCGRASPVCEQVLMAKQPYICYDTSEKHRLFAPGVGYAMWMLVAQPRVDPWWDHAFYLGIGTHFRQWQRVLLKPVGEGVAASQ